MAWDNPAETIDTTTETEYVPLEDYYTETETTPTETTTETIEIVDYSPVITSAADQICGFLLFGSLCICGCLLALHILGVRSS